MADLSWMDDVLEKLDKKRAPSSKRVQTAPQIEQQQLPLELQRFSIDAGYGGKGPMQVPEDLSILLGYTQRF